MEKLTEKELCEAFKVIAQMGYKGHVELDPTTEANFDAMIQQAEINDQARKLFVK